MPGMPHGLTTPLGGILAETHFQLAASHCDEDALDNSPGVTLFAESTQDSRDLWPHDWAMTYTISLCSDDDPVSPFAEPQYTHVEPDDVPDLDTGDPELILPVDDEGPFSREEVRHEFTPSHSSLSIHARVCGGVGRGWRGGGMQILKGNSQTDFMIDEMLPSLPVLRPVHDDDSDDEDAGSGAEDGEEEDSGESDTEAGDVSGGAEGGAAAALDDAAASGAESGDKDGESLSDEARELLGDYASGARSEIKDGDAKAMDSDAEVEFDSDDDAIDSDEEEGGELAADMGDSEDDSGEEEDEASSSEEEEDEEEEVKYDRNDPDIVVPPSQLKFSIAIQNTGAETMVFQAGTFADLTHRDCTQNEGVRVRGLGRKHALDFSRGKTPTVVETDGYFTPVAEPPGAPPKLMCPGRDFGLPDLRRGVPSIDAEVRGVRCVQARAWRRCGPTQQRTRTSCCARARRSSTSSCSARATRTPRCATRISLRCRCPSTTPRWAAAPSACQSSCLRAGRGSQSSATASTTSTGTNPSLRRQARRCRGARRHTTRRRSSHRSAELCRARAGTTTWLW